MGEVIDPTWIAFCAEAPADPGRLDIATERVADHYRATASGELRRESWTEGRVGLLCLSDEARSARWPSFSADQRYAIATAYMPTGWERAVGAGAGVAVEDGPLHLADALAADPELVARELDAPAVVGLADKRAGTLRVINDCLGAGRLYEGRVDGGTIWSNRLGAITLFAGTEPASESRAWELFAAMGWFIGDATPISGCRRLPPGTVIEAGPGGIERRRVDGVGALVSPTDTPRAELVERFGEEARITASAAAELFPEPPRVDLSGGRDSRLAAAAFVSAGVSASYVTSDMTSGEADVARELFARLPGDFDHQVRWGGSQRKTYDRPIRERARAVHLLHDGMRHAAKVRGKMDLPPAPSAAASVSGHGGEIAHGFYYTTPRALAKVERGGREGALARLEQAGRRRHQGAHEACYERARSEIEATLDAGEARGVTGPALLDWFYLMERFSHRSGLAADVERITFFSCRGFLRAAFSLTPAERLGNELHLDATASLVPQWAGVPYFKPQKKRRGSILARLRGRAGREEKRTMIWEGSDGEDLEEMIAAEGAWTELYRPDRVREIWQQARSGSPDPHFQDVFEGIVYREAFSDHLRTLARGARAGEPLFGPKLPTGSP